MDENKRIIDINGIKMEVDLRHAKRVDCFRIGDTVKVLVKEYSSYKINPGVILDFAAFEALPTIVVAYVDVGYSEIKLKLVHINAESKDVEIVAVDAEELAISKVDAIGTLDRDIERKTEELNNAKRLKDVFTRRFSAFFTAHDETGGVQPS